MPLGVAVQVQVPSRLAVAHPAYSALVVRPTDPPRGLRWLGLHPPISTLAEWRDAAAVVAERSSAGDPAGVAESAATRDPRTVGGALGAAVMAVGALALVGTRRGHCSVPRHHLDSPSAAAEVEALGRCHHSHDHHRLSPHSTSVRARRGSHACHETPPSSEASTHWPSSPVNWTRLTGVNEEEGATTSPEAGVLGKGGKKEGRRAGHAEDIS